MKKTLLIFIILVILSAPAIGAGAFYRRYSTTTTHTILNAAGISMEAKQTLRLVSVAISFSAAQTSTFQLEFDSGLGVLYDVVIDSSTLTAANDYLWTAEADEEIILFPYTIAQRDGSSTSRTPDALDFTASGADSATAYIVVTYEILE